MGSGIAQVAAVAGHDVVLRDVTDEALGKGTAAIEKSLGALRREGHPRGVRRRRRPGPDHDDHRPRRGRVTADVVVEAAFESLEVKQEIFRGAGPALPGRRRAGHEHQRDPDHPDRRR